MKMALKAVVAILLGLGLGAVGAIVFLRIESLVVREALFDGQWPPKQTTGQAAHVNEIVVEGSNPRNLGTIQSGKRTDIEFMVRNATTNQIEFGLAGEPPTTLKVDLSAGSTTRLPAQITFPITVSVTPNEIDPNFTKSIVLQTENGNKTVLTVAANVSGGVIATPSQLQISRKDIGAAPMVKTIVASFVADNLEISDVRIDGLDNPSWISWTVTKLGSDQFPQFSGVQSAMAIDFSFIGELPPNLSRIIAVVKTNQPGFEPLQVPISITE